MVVKIPGRAGLPGFGARLCVTLSRFLKCSGLQFLHLHKGIIIVSYRAVVKNKFFNVCQEFG